MIRMHIAENNPYLEELQYHLAKLGAGSMPRTAAAMKAGASLIKSRWVDFANGGPLEGVPEKLKKSSGGYAKSIKSRKNGPFAYDIYSEAKVADWIENGTDDLDMKTTHPFGPRSRVMEQIVSKRTGKVIRKGGSYLIIPIRWGMPGTVGFKNVMPVNVYAIVKKFKKMKTTVSADSPNARQTPNAQTPSRMVGRASYNKGYDRLSAAEAGDEPNASGMVRSTDSTGKNRSGGYFTFRIISTNSPKDSWKRKGMPARHVTTALVRETQEPINTMVEGAIMEDLGPL